MPSTYQQRRLLQHGYMEEMTCYLALFTPSGTELAVPGYSRKLINWQMFMTTPVVIMNSNQITWGPVPANWGDVAAMAIYDSLSGGNMLEPPKALPQVVTLTTGKTFSVAPYSCEVRL